MKVINKNKATRPLCAIASGEAFEYDGTNFMRINDGALKTEHVLCCQLNDGRIVAMNANTMVVPVNAQIVIS